MQLAGHGFECGSVQLTCSNLDSQGICKIVVAFERNNSDIVCRAACFLRVITMPAIDFCINSPSSDWVKQSRIFHSSGHALCINWTVLTINSVLPESKEQIVISEGWTHHREHAHPRLNVMHCFLDIMLTNIISFKTT
jgi:hypothetical protein